MFKIVASLIMLLFCMAGSATTPEWVVKTSGGKVPPKVAEKYVKLINKSAKAEGVDPKMIFRIAKAESHFIPTAESNKGAVGIMQVLPKYHQEKILGRDIRKPEVNIEVGTKIYAEYLRKYKTPEKALRAYNGLAGKQGEYSGIVMAVKLPGEKTSGRRIAVTPAPSRKMAPVVEYIDLNKVKAKDVAFRHPEDRAAESIRLAKQQAELMKRTDERFKEFAALVTKMKENPKVTPYRRVATN